jgi:hypothetical protein
MASPILVVTAVESGLGFLLTSAIIFLVLTRGKQVYHYLFTEHVIITNFGELIGGHSDAIHLVSIAIGIAVMMPVKRRVEHTIEKYFAQKQLVF